MLKNNDDYQYAGHRNFEKQRYTEKANNLIENRSSRHSKVNDHEGSDVDSDCGLVVVSHALSTIVKTNWIVDSGATSHMCNDESLFSKIKHLLNPQAVQVGDGHSVEAKSEGTVELKITLSSGVSCCKLSNVLYVPDLSYNLLSVSKAAKSGKVIEFHADGCNIINKNSKIIAAATKIGDLYFLNCINDDTAYTVQNNKFDSRCKMVTL